MPQIIIFGIARCIQNVMDSARKKRNTILETI